VKSFPWTKCSNGFATILINILERNNFFCHGIDQDQTENCLQLEPDLILAVSTIPPRIDKLMSSGQAHALKCYAINVKFIKS
jgi:hypothetical protein